MKKLLSLASLLNYPLLFHNVQIDSALLEDLKTLFDVLKLPSDTKLKLPCVTLPHCY